MTTYNDIMVRDSLTDTGIIPNPNFGSYSPDIMPQQSPADPSQVQQLFGSATYNQNPGQPLEQGQNNYMYVRAKNLYSQTTSGTLNLYYCPAGTWNIPSEWRNNLVGSQPIGPLAPGQIMAAAEPIIWQPPSGASSHFCFVLQVVTQRHPNPIPTSWTDFDDWYDWASSDAGIAYRNVSMYDDIPPGGYETTANLINPNSTPQFCPLRLVCTNCPIGSVVSLYCPSPLPQPTINATHTMTSSNYDLAVAPTLPANFQSQVYAKFQPPAGSDPSQARIVLENYCEAATSQPVPHMHSAVAGALMPQLGEDAMQYRVVKVGEYTVFDGTLIGAGA